MSPFQIRADPGEPGDEYVAAGAWGRYGAAGILVRHVDDGGVARYLLAKGAPGLSQERWALPGGALHSLETPAQGAAREIQEELGVSQDYLDRLDIVGMHVTAGPNRWRYTTFAASALETYTPTVEAREVAVARWIADDELRAMADCGQVHSALTKHLDTILALYTVRSQASRHQPTPG